jgi:anti-sigma-K factor RskA
MIEAPRHPRDAEAFEYVLGSGSAAERAAFARDLERDASLSVAVRYWEERLAVLAETVPPVSPSPGLIDAITARVSDGDAAPRGGDVVPFAEAARLRRSRAIWRGVAAGAASLAAALALWIAADRFATAPAGEKLVAVVNRSGDLPALIVRVDQRSGTVQIRSVAAEVPPDRSLELWSIAPGSAPRSLGLVGPGTTRVSLPGGAGAISSDVTLAVTVEPPGGAPAGIATGPVVYSGKLIPDR